MSEISTIVQRALELQPVLERRHTERYPCNIVTAYHCLGADGSAPKKARLLDLSVTGMALRVSQVDSRSPIIVVELPATEATSSHSVLLRICHVEAGEIGIDWTIGGVLAVHLDVDEVLDLARSFPVEQT